MKFKHHTIVLVAALAVSCARKIPSEKPDPTVLELSAKVSELRQLPFKDPVHIGRKSPDEIRTYLNKRIAEEYSPGELEVERKIYVLLGLLKPDFPYVEKILSLLSDQIAGYYDPTQDTLFISNKTGEAELKEVIAHELTHALQDQHFHLESLMKRIHGNDDQSMALNALLEGEALAVMTEFALEKQKPTQSTLVDLATIMKVQIRASRKEDSRFKEIPSFLFESLLFPYIEGLRFIQMIRTHGGWNDVNKTYRTLPVSSEQILHPEKYIQHVDPPVEVSEKLFQGNPLISKVLSSNVMGEFGVRMILSSKLPEEVSDRAAEGWGGDRYWLIQSKDGGEAWLWATVWDHDTDAVEFYKTFVESRPALRETSFLKDKRVFVVIGLNHLKAQSLFDSWK